MTVDICVWEYAGAFLFALLLVLAVVPLNIRVSRRLRLVDQPNYRTVHAGEMPSAGGISIALTFLLIQGYILVTKPGMLGSSQAISALFCVNLAVVALGVCDDRFRLGAWPKLILEIGLITTLFLSGLRIERLTNPFGPDFTLGLLSYPVTLLWFLGVMNAFNLIDGIDGVAAGIAVIVSGVLSVSGLIFANHLIVFMALGLMGASLGFLRYNFHPARIFMGDTGSLFLGFNIAAIPVISAGQIKGITAMTLLVPILAMFIPLTDTISAVFRRLRHRQPLFTGDKGHLHHRLMNLGLSQRGVALVIYFITLLFGLIAVGFSFTTRKAVLILFIFLAAVLAGFLLLLFRLAETLRAQHSNASKTEEGK